jgi:predicted cupin superfamily sugar epimerase
LSTGIYFLIDRGAFSAFHRIKTDEMWHFYAGDSLLIHMIDAQGNYSSQTIGASLAEDEKLQFVVPAGVWFASEVKNGGDYSLVGCTVSPGFDFSDFELANRSLLERFPKHRELLSRLIR